MFWLTYFVLPSANDMITPPGCRLDGCHVSAEWPGTAVPNSLLIFIHSWTVPGVMGLGGFRIGLLFTGRPESATCNQTMMLDGNGGFVAVPAIGKPTATGGGGRMTFQFAAVRLSEKIAVLLA